MSAHDPLPSPTDLDPVRSDDDLHERWRLLLSDEPFDGPSLWVTWYDADGRQLPIIVPVEDVPHRPGMGFVDRFAELLAQIAGQEPGAWVSLALARPGSALISSDDRTWAEALRRALSRHGVSARPMFLATEQRVRQIVLDDL